MKPNNIKYDMTADEFRDYGYQFIDWVANYLNDVENYPVLSKAQPNSIIKQLPDVPPLEPEKMSDIFNDFNKILMPGITHWNHPNFMAYFNSTSTGSGILAELLSAALNINGMLWKTSPASTELEIKVLDWLRQMIGLPEHYFGIIYDLASISSMHAIAAAREHAKQTYKDYDITKQKIYISKEAHSSIEKAVKTLGFNEKTIEIVETDENFSMRPEVLLKKIEKDLTLGYQPFCVVATIGTTSSTAIDPVDKIINITLKYNLWLHVDAAYAGSAAILPEKRNLFKGIELADSFVFNPHKWLFIPIDLSVLFISKPELLKKAFSVIPEYLSTKEESQVINFMDYGIQLGRRFRSLKLWFTIRYFGVRGLQNIIRHHITLAEKFKKHIKNDPNFQLLAPVPFSTICFRATPDSFENKNLNKFNSLLLQEINSSGNLFISHTKLNGIFTLRVAISGVRTTEKHVETAWQVIKSKTFELIKKGV